LLAGLGLRQPDGCRKPPSPRCDLVPLTSLKGDLRTAQSKVVHQPRLTPFLGDSGLFARQIKGRVRRTQPLV
jgi:hypothetical protein